MKERPILFSGPMVQAILKGTKSQTRRVVKNCKQFADWDATPADAYDSIIDAESGEATFLVAGDHGWVNTVKCPYGKIGDVLWVRETFYAYGKWVKNGHSKTGKQQWKFVDLYDNGTYPDNHYKYMDGPPLRVQTGKSDVIGWYKRPSLFMLRAACRIRLQITDVRVERLQDISESDAKNEGIESFRPVPGDGPAETMYKMYLPPPPHYQQWSVSPVHSFKSLWRKINGTESWDQNPWVWVINFKRI